MVNKNKFSIGMILVMTILTLSSVLAFGVSSPYWEGNPLTIYPGETKTIEIGYQNMGSDAENLVVRAEITKGNEIATISQQDYNVIANTKDTQVRVTVSVPESVPIGTGYKVTLTSRTVTPGVEGGVGLGVGMDTTFDVLVVEKPKPAAPVETTQIQVAEESPDTTWIVTFVLLAIIVIAIILLLIINARKKTGKNK